MIYVRLLTDHEQQELKRMTRHEIGRISQRAQMVLLSAQGRSAPEIAAIFALSGPSVRFWLRRFEEGGPPGLRDAPRSGRPPKVTAPLEQAVLNLLLADPLQAGYLASFWTVAMLGLALLGRLGVALSESCIRSTLRRLRLSWHRPRLAMPQKVDPDKALKQWRIAEAVFAAGPQTPILYADESRIELLPRLRGMWQWIGQQLRIPTPGSNDSRSVFGALNIRTGRWDYLIRPRQRSEDFLAFLEHLLTQYATGPLILIVDNYSSHKAKEVRAWLGAHPRLQLHYLPTYCSHLDPVENIWLRLKNEIAANRLYGSMKLLLQAVDRFFAEMTPEQALTWVAA